MKSRKKI